ncbi:hypothetical protein [Paraburkholderia sp. DGU8]|uniref:hypothetical protein n=1 Tax=Paraburkholderia sp. DGU8 TaxID=3161997 RepID=UPI003465B668
MGSDMGGKESARSRGDSTPRPVHCVLVIYFAAYLARIVKVMGALMEAQSVATLRVVINNPQIDESVVKQHFASLSAPVRILRHDNTGLEFGAYQRGLDDLRRTDADDLPCLFANDTVGSHYPITTFYLRKFSSAAQEHLGSNAIVGLVDWSARRLQLCGLHTSRWVRSNLFVMDRQALQSIDNALYVARLDACIHDSPSEDEFFADAIGPSLRAHLRRWLFSGSPDAWYQSAPLSPDNHRRMAAKARSILQELFLSMRLDSAATAFIQPQLSKVEKALVNLGCATV